MKRLFIGLVFLGMLVAAVSTTSHIARAQSTLSESQIESIRQNCVSAQTILSQLHASDALMRVDRGTLYENISNKLMASLNSRIAYSRLEGLRMASITLEYDRQFDAFRANYKQYEESMSRTFKMNCAQEPVEFYERVALARARRANVHQNTRALTGLLQDYKTAFEDFAKLFEEQKQ